MHARLLPPALCLLLLTTVLPAQDWPRFRGPDGGGLSDAQLPAKWEPTHTLWKAALPGVGHASAVAWGDRVPEMAMRTAPPTA